MSGQPQRRLSDSAKGTTSSPDAPAPVLSPAVANADAGPSRQPQTSGSQHDEWMADFARLSRLPPPALPTTCLRGTSSSIPDVFPPSTLAEIDDAALLRSLPLLGPPAPPAAEPLWGISAQRFQLLPSPAATLRPVDPVVQSNLARFHDLKQRGVHFNESLLSNRAFKNPHVYAQLVDLLDLDESRSNLPLLDTQRAAGWRAKLPLTQEELVEGDPIATLTLQQQQHEQRLRQKRAAGANRTIAFSSATHNDTEEKDNGPTWDKHASSTTTSRDREDRKRTRSSKDEVESKRRARSDGHHRSRSSEHASSSSRDRPRRH